MSHQAIREPIQPESPWNQIKRKRPLQEGEAAESWVPQVSSVAAEDLGHPHIHSVAALPVVPIPITAAISVAVLIEITIMPVKIATPIKIIPIVNYVTVATRIVACEVPASRNPIAVRHVAVSPNIAGAWARVGRRQHDCPRKFQIGPPALLVAPRPAAPATIATPNIKLFMLAITPPSPAGLLSPGLKICNQPGSFRFEACLLLPLRRAGYVMCKHGQC